MPEPQSQYTSYCTCATRQRGNCMQQAVACAPSNCRLLLTDCRTADEYCGPNPYSTLREMLGLVQMSSQRARAPDADFRIVVVDEGPVAVLLEPEV